jgi:hypothetical protein
MAVKLSWRPQNIATSSIQRTVKICPNCNIWYENILPSGNPGFISVAKNISPYSYELFIFWR